MVPPTLAILANYWGNYSGIDADGNGIGDSAYLAQPFDLEYDHYPMIAATSSYIPGGSTSPIADFTASTQVGTAR